VHFHEHGDADERRWMEEHGPVTPGLIKHLKARATTTPGLLLLPLLDDVHGVQVAPGKSIVVPTAEEDATVALRLFRDWFRLPAAYAQLA
jgi:hypothetical protein